MEIKKPVNVDKVWGYEEIIANIDKYCGKRLHLRRGFRSSIHSHPKEETLFIESGQVFMELGEDSENMESRILNPGDIIHIFSNGWHRFSGLQDSIIVETSTPDTPSERKTRSELIPDFEKWKEEIIK